MLKNTFSNIIFSAIFALILSSVAAAQEDIQPNLETILKNANQQTHNYREEFKNLLSEETKTFEIFDKNGNIKKRSVVESNFIIFQSAKDENITSEYRDVYKVDNREVGDNKDRANDLLAQLAKSGTVEQELNKIQKESLRYDKNLEISGLTLLQSPILEEYVRPYFDFTLAGRENFNNSEVFVVEYRQTKPSPYVSVNQENTAEQLSNRLSLDFKLDLPKNINKSNVFLRGKLWIDTKTFQIWREKRELIARTENPLTLIETVFEYQPSDYGILVPKDISLVQYAIKKNTKENQVSAVKDTKVNFVYTKFRKSNSDVQILDDN